MRRDVLVYLSGPISPTVTRSVEFNVARACDVFFRLLRAGVPALCPHLSAAFPSAFSIPYEKWMDYDYALIDRSTHILMLDGWESSPGAKLEREYGWSTGKVIVYDVDVLANLVSGTNAAVV